MDSRQLFSGRGRLFLALYTAGILGDYEFAGSVPAASLSPTTSKTEHKESETGKDAVDSILEGETKVGFTATFEDHQAKNLARALRGVVIENAGATVTDQLLPVAPKAGNYVSLGAVNVTDLEIESSAGAALVPNVDYRIESSKHGSIQILDATKFVLAAKASFTSGVSRSFGIMSEGQKKYRLRFEGLNKASDGKAVLIEFDCQLEPAKTLSLINGSEFASYELAGDVLFADGTFGKVTEIG